MLAAQPPRNRSEPLGCKKLAAALYLLGNIQSGKSEKNFNPLEDSGLAENSLLAAPTYLRNIQTGKSKKKSSPSRKVLGIARDFGLNPLLM